MNIEHGRTLLKSKRTNCIVNHGHMRKYIRIDTPANGRQKKKTLDES